MKHTFIILALCMATAVQAQPTKRRTTTSNEAAQAAPAKASTTTKATASPTVDRAALLFPTADEMPEDVVWKRDIYRQLDLNLDANAPLYYPIEPVGNQCNLFTYLFRLFLTGRVAAYNYKLDGNESFAEKDKITDVRELLDRYYIYYEEANGKFTVADNDVPSAFVKRYYIKESSYLDQRTGTYHAKVVAICPILLESDDWGDSATPKPLFWMKYDDLAPYLGRLPVMSSNYNNVTRTTADDYFQMNHYEGKIYKTSNMQGQVLSDYCKDEASMAAEQEKIDAQLEEFEQRIRQVKQAQDAPAVDSTEAEASAKKTTARKTTTSAKTSKKETVSADNRRVAASKSTKQQKTKTSSKSAATASVRRTRR